MRLWDWPNGAKAGEFRTGNIFGRSVSPYSEIAATHSATAITLWDVASGEKILIFYFSPSKVDEKIETFTDNYVKVQFSSSGQLVASWNDRGIISVWNAEKGCELCLLGCGSEQIVNRRNRHQYTQEKSITSIAFSSNDQFLAAGYEHGLIQVRNLTEDEILSKLSRAYREACIFSRW